jgi:hypothetical protein
LSERNDGQGIKRAHIPGFCAKVNGENISKKEIKKPGETWFKLLVEQSFTQDLKHEGI